MTNGTIVTAEKCRKARKHWVVTASRAKTAPRRGERKAASPFSAWILHLDINNLTALTAVYGSPYGQALRKPSVYAGPYGFTGLRPPRGVIAVPAGPSLALNQTKSR